MIILKSQTEIVNPDNIYVTLFISVISKFILTVNYQNNDNKVEVHNSLI